PRLSTPPPFPYTTLFRSTRGSGTPGRLTLLPGGGRDGSRTGIALRVGPPGRPARRRGDPGRPPAAHPGPKTQAAQRVGAAARDQIGRAHGLNSSHVKISY